MYTIPIFSLRRRLVLMDLQVRLLLSFLFYALSLHKIHCCHQKIQYIFLRGRRCLWWCDERLEPSAPPTFISADGPAPFNIWATWRWFDLYWGRNICFGFVSLIIQHDGVIFHLFVVWLLIPDLFSLFVRFCLLATLVVMDQSRWWWRIC